MNPTPENRPLTWSELAVLAILAGLFLLGLTASSPSLLHALVGIAGLAFVLACAWLYHFNVRKMRTEPPLTSRQVAWQLAFGVASMVVIFALAWWCAGQGGCAGRQGSLRSDTPLDAGPPEQWQGDPAAGR
jgi:hypothetical protein